MNRYYGQNGALLCSETHDEMTAVDKDVYKDIGNSEALKKNRTNNSSVIVSSSTRGDMKGRGEARTTVSGRFMVLAITEDHYVGVNEIKRVLWRAKHNSLSADGIRYEDIGKLSGMS